MTVTGLLLLFMALSSAHVQRLPVSTSFIYLVVGLVVGPAGFNVLRIDVDEQRQWFETLTEVALIVSLFVGGLKLRLPLNHSSWRTALVLAVPVMLVSIAGTAAAAHLLLGMPVLLALLVGAALAPTDPVLASTVSVNDAEDHDRVRFALSGEAGLNDGMAFPFVLVALEAMRVGGFGGWVIGWGLPHLVWSIPFGLLIGYALGQLVGRSAIALRSAHRDTAAPSDFLALALIALSFVVAERAHALGFLATFAAGVGLRHAELHVVTESPLPDHVQRRVEHWFRREDGEPPRPRDPDAVPHPPAESMVPSVVNEQALEQPVIAAGVLISEALSFGDTVERLLEVLLVVMVGIMLADVWSWRALLLAGALFFVIRPLATTLLLRGTRTNRAQRRLLGWFGIRGIGSLYYVAYALNHGVRGTAAVALLSTVVTVIAVSVTVHGISVTPILNWYERSLARKK